MSYALLASRKTFTMEGLGLNGSGAIEAPAGRAAAELNDVDLRGIIPRSVEEIFNCRCNPNPFIPRCAGTASVRARQCMMARLIILCCSVIFFVLVQTSKTPRIPTCASSYARRTFRSTVRLLPHTLLSGTFVFSAARALQLTTKCLTLCASFPFLSFQTR